MLIIIMLFFLNSNGQIDKDIIKNKSIDSIQEIVDYIEEVPYEIQLNSNKLVLPDSIGGNTIEGQIGIAIVINENSKIIEYKIFRLLVVSKKTRQKIIDYPNESIHYYYIRYYPFVRNYVNKINVIKVGNPQKKNRMSILIRFGNR